MGATKLGAAAQVLEGERLRETLAGYYGLTSHVDNQRNLFFSRLAHEENTVVLFTSDHGEMLGDHYLFRKSAPYQGTVNMPFLLSDPQISP